jgi:hypothetical protein
VIISQKLGNVGQNGRSTAAYRRLLVTRFVHFAFGLLGVPLTLFGHAELTRAKSAVGDEQIWL